MGNNARGEVVLDAELHSTYQNAALRFQKFERLLGYAVSEDGALHAEKFYWTVREEFAATRPAVRWRQTVALARVTASEFGQAAPGYAEACERLKVQAGPE